LRVGSAPISLITFISTWVPYLGRPWPVTALSASTFLAALVACRKALKSLLPDADGAADGHRLEVLRAHHGANAGAPGGTVQVVHHAGVEHLVLAGAADRGDADLRVLVRRLDGLLGVPGGLAPEMGSVAQLGLVVLDRDRPAWATCPRR
jgi:hypothetical protein